MAEGGFEEGEMDEEVIYGIPKLDLTPRVPLNKSPIPSMPPLYFLPPYEANSDEIENNASIGELSKIEHDDSGSLYSAYNSEHMEVAEDAERAGSTSLENRNCPLAQQEEVSSFLDFSYLNPERPPNPPPTAANLYMRNPLNDIQ